FPSSTLLRSGARAVLGEGALGARELELPAMAMELEIAAAVVAADDGAVYASVGALTELAEQAVACRSILTETWARTCQGWLLLRLDPAGSLPVIEASLADARRL